ncbi:MAG: hypothetical protein ABIJ16_00685 [Bacteroidota bacterium]
MKYSDDVSSIDSIVSANICVLSGEKGEKRDWNRFRYHYYPEAKLIGIFHRKDTVIHRETTVEEFIEKAGNSYESFGFHERQLGLEVDKFGHIAQVFQSFEASYEKDGVMMKKRGINAYQLMFKDNRWWILSITWEDETESNLIPEDYLTRN